MPLPHRHDRLATARGEAGVSQRDAELLARLRAGDVQAFEVVFRTPLLVIGAGRQHALQSPTGYLRSDPIESRALLPRL